MTLAISHSVWVTAGYISGMHGSDGRISKEENDSILLTIPLIISDLLYLSG